MAKQINFLLAQQNFIVGDIAGNTQIILNTLQEARSAGDVHVVVFPECALSGYPPEDLLFQSGFRHEIEAALETIRSATQGIAVVLGHPHWRGEQCYNAASVYYDQNLLLTYYKQSLPNYGVFDERRYFTTGKVPGVVHLFGMRIGILVCEDAWSSSFTLLAKQAGAEFILVLNASPFYVNRYQHRHLTIKQRVLESDLPICSVYNVGGQDELIFDGGSFFVDQEGHLSQIAPYFETANAKLCFEKDRQGIWVATCADIDQQPPGKLKQLYDALCLATKDYVTKSGFQKVMIGVSGGIDSALVLCIAVDALGPENVEAILLPSQYTSTMSNEDAIALADNLGVAYHIIPIEPSYNVLCEALSPILSRFPKDLTEENIQARIRGTLLMALSNKLNALLLSTSNKSEVAVGYSTLYGDMAGAFAVIKDVYKTDVYRLAKYRNQREEVIPLNIITRSPSAELRPDQTDQDSLPDYDILDSILKLHIEQNFSYQQLVDEGFNQTIVQQVLAMIRRSEHKRFQSGPGPKVSPRGFNKDWRMPIVNGFEDE